MRTLSAFEIVAAIYNVNRDTEKRKEPFTAAELMGIEVEREPAGVQSADEMVAVLEAVMGCGPNRGTKGREMGKHG